MKWWEEKSVGGRLESQGIAQVFMCMGGPGEGAAGVNPQKLGKRTENKTRARKPMVVVTIKKNPCEGPNALKIGGGAASGKSAASKKISGKKATRQQCQGREAGQQISSRRDRVGRGRTEGARQGQV